MSKIWCHSESVSSQFSSSSSSSPERSVMSVSVSSSESFQVPFFYSSIASTSAWCIKSALIGRAPFCRFGAPAFLNSFNWSFKARPLKFWAFSLSRIRSSCAMHSAPELPCGQFFQLVCYISNPSLTFSDNLWHSIPFPQCFHQTLSK